MTNGNADSANNIGLPAVLGYIDGVQEKACRLAGIMEAIDFLDNENQCASGQTALIIMAKELALEINNQLDSTALSKVAS